MESTLLPTLTDSGLVTMTEVLWKTLTRTTGPYFLALETKMTQSSLLALGDVNIIITTQQEGQGVPSQGLSHTPQWVSVSTSMKQGSYTPPLLGIKPDRVFEDALAGVKHHRICGLLPSPTPHRAYRGRN